MCINFYEYVWQFKKTLVEIAEFTNSVTQILYFLIYYFKIISKCTL